MATHPEPLDILLRASPSLPRAALDRLVTQAIDRMDELDPDPDAEDGDGDACHAHDDDPTYVDAIFGRGDGYPGDPDDAEEGGDLEGIDEREPENEDGEAGSVPPPNARKSREAHVGRIRRTRCHRIERRRFGWAGDVTDVHYALRMSTRAATLTMLRRRHPRLRQRKRRP